LSGNFSDLFRLLRPSIFFFSSYTHESNTHLAFVSANELASLSTFTLTLEILIGCANTLAYRGKQKLQTMEQKD